MTRSMDNIKKRKQTNTEMILGLKLEWGEPYTGISRNTHNSNVK